MTELPPIEDSIAIDATRSEVFNALTDARELEQWLATRAESDPRDGGRFRYVFEFDDPAQNNQQEGAYATVEPDRRLVLPWVFPFSDKETTVEYELAGDGGETVVRFTHAGFEAGGPWAVARERFAGGWRAFLEALKARVEQGGEHRPLGVRGR